MLQNRLKRQFRQQLDGSTLPLSPHMGEVGPISDGECDELSMNTIKSSEKMEPY